jgi:hypothetical protein
MGSYGASTGAESAQMMVTPRLSNETMGTPRQAARISHMPVTDCASAIDLGLDAAAMAGRLLVVVITNPL